MTLFTLCYRCSRTWGSPDRTPSTCSTRARRCKRQAWRVNTGWPTAALVQPPGPARRSCMAARLGALLLQPLAATSTATDSFHSTSCVFLFKNPQLCWFWIIFNRRNIKLCLHPSKECFKNFPKRETCRWLSILKCQAYILKFSANSQLEPISVKHYLKIQMAMNSIKNFYSVFKTLEDC